MTLSKEGSSGEYALEAGALVLADQGCCCIDEFDKMGSQHQALLEAMVRSLTSLSIALYPFHSILYSVLFRNSKVSVSQKLEWFAGTTKRAWIVMY